VAWSILQSASAQAPGGTTYFPAVTFGTNLSSGSKIICIIAIVAAVPAGINQVGDGASGGGNQLTSIADFNSAGTGPSIVIYAMDTPSGDVGTKPTITASLVNKSDTTMLIQEVTGLAAGVSGIIDGTPGTNGPHSPPAASMGPPSYASSASGELLYYLYADDEGQQATPTNAWTWTAPAGYTADPNSLNAQGTIAAFINNLAVAYKNSTNGTETGAYSATPATGAAIYGQLMVAVKLAGVSAVSGQLQPLPTFPVPRRRPARGVRGGIRGPAFVQVAAPQQPPGLPPRRVPSRAVTRGSAPFGGFVKVAAPQQARLFPRRRLSRAVVQFTPVATANAAPAAVPGQIQPRATVPVPRRSLAKALWRGITGQGFVPVAAPRQLPPVPRRVLSRAWWRGLAVPGLLAFPPRQPPYLPSRRSPARALTGTRPPQGAVAAFVTVPAPAPRPAFPRRVPARAYIRFTPVATVNAPPPAFAPAPPHRAPDDKSQWKKLLLLGY
jgi:hypothetical protein